MVPRRLRLTRSTFPSSSVGQRLSSAHLTLVWGSTVRGGGCAVVISKKVARRSVDRHLLKRRLMTLLLPWCSRECFFVVYARAGSKELPFHTLAHELQGLLMKTGRSMAQ